MWLVVGLGNPEPTYLMNRHNIGFMALDTLVHSAGSPRWKSEHQAQTLKVKIGSTEVLLAKPQTYMNLSGRAVRALMDYYKIDLDHLLVVHDDIDQKFGSLRVHFNRGAGGHNGIKNITELLGSQNYARLKLGVGRPSHPGQNVADYVLQNFSASETEQLGPFLDRGLDALECVILDGWERAANRFNSQVEKDGQ